MDHSNLLEYDSLVEAFDSLAAMRGDDDAVLRNGTDEYVSYSEIQFYSQQLAAILYHRFGLRRGDTVLLHCQSNTEAEIVSCVAASRLHAPFIAIDVSWLEDNSRMAVIVEETSPKVAIIVGKPDNHPAVNLLSKHGIFRHLFIECTGAIDSNDMSFADVPELNDDNQLLDWQKLLSPSFVSKFYPCLSIVNCTDVDLNSYGYPLCILYTSGSTGRPKGVICTSRSLINRIAFQYKHFPFDFEEVVYRRTPLTFVDSLVEIFGPLLAGIPIYSASALMRNSGDILELIKEASSSEAQISRITMLPTQLSLVMEYLPTWKEIWPSLRIVNISGEPCSTSLVHKFAELMGECMLVNYYGSTEIGGDVTYAVLHSATIDDDALDQDTICETTDKSVFAPIGKAIENNKLYVVNEIAGSDQKAQISSASSLRFVLAPAGRTGELLVQGCHLALGYCQNTDATNQRFLRNPLVYLDETLTKCIPTYRQNVTNELLEEIEDEVDDDDNNSDNDEKEDDDDNNSDNDDDENELETDNVENKSKQLSGRQNPISIFFRTGDIVQEDANSPGVLTWLGRVDSQVKVRGVRVELEDAENQIARCLGLDTTREIAVIANALNPPVEAASTAAGSSDGTSNIGSSRLVLYVDKSILVKPSVQALLRKDQVDRNQGGQEDSAFNIFEIKTYISAKIAPIFVPSLIFPLDSLPRNITGKIIRKKLESILIELLDINESSTSANGTEDIVADTHASKRSRSNHDQTVDREEVCDILISLLHRVLPSLSSQLGVIPLRASTDKRNFLLDSSFAVLGGDSMTAVEYMWSIKNEFKVVSLHIGLQHVFTHTIRGLADVVYESSLSSKPAIAAVTSTASTDIRIHSSSSIEMTSHSDMLMHFYEQASKVPGICGTSPCQQRVLAVSSDESLPATEANCFIKLFEVGSQPLLRCVDSSPLILQFSGEMSSSMSVAYIGSHGGDLIAVDIATNTLLWSVRGDMRVEASVGWCQSQNHAVVDKPVDSASLDEREPLLFVASYSASDVDGHSSGTRLDGLIGAVMCIGAVSGKVKWTTGFPAELKSQPVVCLCDHLVYVGCYDGKLYRLRSGNGHIVDSFDCDGAIYAKVALDSCDSNIFVCTIKGKLYCIKVNGSNMELKYEIDFEAAIYSSPVLFEHDESRLFIVGNIAGNLYCCNQIDGVKRWTYNVSRAIFSTPSLFKNPLGGNYRTVFGCHDGYLRCVCSVTGSLQWEQCLNSVVFSSPTIGSLLTKKNQNQNQNNLSSDNSVASIAVLIACTTAGVVYVLSLHDGRILSEIQLKAEIYSSPQITYIDGSAADSSRLNVLVGARDDRLHIFSLSCI